MMAQIQTDRKSCPSQHSVLNKLLRLLWGVVWLLLFRPSPWFWHGPRRLLLRLFGAQLGRSVQVMPSVKIWAPWNLDLGNYTTVSHGVDLYAVDRIKIGAHATVSQRTFICTASHDIDHPHMPLVKAPIAIHDGAWVCAEAFIHPGVSVGADAVVAARAVAVKNVGDRQVVAGNPAQFIRYRFTERDENRRNHE